MSTLIQLPRARTVVALKRFRCATCAYGASSRMAPERCPMCGGTAWHFERRLPAASPGV
jgi:rubrerythrin